MFTRVLPFSEAPTAVETDAPLLYELVPADPLPKLDLSVSIKSRLVFESWQPAVTRLLRRGKTIFFMYAVGNVVGTVTLTCDARIGRVLGFFSFVLQAPAPLTGLALLRLYVVRELVGTFDFWFFFVTTTSALVLLGAQLADGRVWVVFTTWLCMVPNMLIDANLRGASRMAMSNSLAIIACIVLLVVMKFSEIDEANNFAIFRQGKRLLDSSDFIFNGIVTMIALLGRNVVRLRAALSSRSGSHEIHCVSYRCVLRLVLKTQSEQHKPTSESLTASAHKHRRSTIPSVDHIQELMLKSESDAIDSRRVLWRGAMCSMLYGGVLIKSAYRCLGWCSLTLAVAGSGIVRVFGSTYPLMLTVSSRASFVSVSAFFLASAASFQRRLLWRLVSSFDFLYLSAQITITHLTACNACAWELSRCLLVSASWLWIHWALCVDAVTPLLKETIQVHLRFPAVVLTVGVVNALLLTYAVVFFHASKEPYDRVLPLFEAKVSVGVLPIFCNSLVTVLLICARLLYRAWTFSGGKLLVLEGEVMYQNYLSNAKLVRTPLVEAPSQTTTQ